MSRAIKFRMWDKALKKFLVADLLDRKYDIVSFWAYADGLPLQQFTGLLDKNGKEIYEGDIVSINDRQIIDEVFFLDGYFGFGKEDPKGKYPGGGIYSFDPILTSDRIEVIGNIYENPTLLKEGV